MFMAPTEFEDANGFCSWDRACSMVFFADGSLARTFKYNLTPSSLAGRVDFEARHTLVNIPWLIAYLLLAMVQGTAIKGREPASRAKELLQLITSLPSCELEAPCARGASVMSTRGESNFSGTQWIKSGAF